VLATARRLPLRSRLALALPFVLLQIPAARAAGQTPQPDSAARDSAAIDSARVARLRPVVVTVLQTPFDLSRAPYAVTALGLRDIQSGRPGLNLAEALVAVPGVQVDNRFNYAIGERISVRGFGARAQFGVRGVRVLLDGIPATLPDGQTTLNHVDIATLGRMEVVRGPASAIYGNASGGVLQLESAVPPDARFEQRVRMTGGEDGLTRLQSQTGGTVGTAERPLGYFANVSHLKYDGYRDFADAKNLTLSGGVDFGGPRTRVRVVTHAVDYTAKNPGSLSDSLLRADRDQAFANNVRQRTGESGRHGELGVTVQQAIAGGELAMSAWGIARELDNPIPGEIIDLERLAGGARAAYAARFALGSVPVQWALGAEAQGQRDDRKRFRNNLGERDTLRLDQEERVTTLAAFARAAADLTPRLSILAAGRVDRARFEAEDRLISETDPDDSGERPMSEFSPSVGVSYAAGGGTTLYANAATAFETPTTTELANRPTGAGGFNPELEPQRTVSFEAGGSVQLGGRGLAQLSAYRARIRDALIPFEVEGAPGRVFYRNAGSAIHRGVELGLTFLLLGDLTLRSAYTFTDARFDEYTVGGTSFSDKRVPGVAPHRVDAVLSYTAPDGRLGGLFVDLEERYLSDVEVNDANAPGSASPAYAVTNVRVGFGRVRVGGAEVAPFVGLNNVFDREYNTSVVVNAFGGRYYEPGPGRTIYAGLDLAARVR
jgi:iron complex outermembrane receptor protein